MSKARQTYTEEFQAEAVRLVLEQGLTLQSAAINETAVATRRGSEVARFPY